MCSVWLYQFRDTQCRHGRCMRIYRTRTTRLLQEDMSWLAQAFADALDLPSLSMETVGQLRPEALLAAQNQVWVGRYINKRRLLHARHQGVKAPVGGSVFSIGLARGLDAACTNHPPHDPAHPSFPVLLFPSRLSRAAAAG